MESLLTRKEIAARLRRVRFAERVIPFVWIFAVSLAVSKVVREGAGTFRDTLLLLFVFVYLPILLTMICSFWARTQRLILQVDAIAKLLRRNRALQEERDALVSGQRRAAAKAGNQHNRELQERAKAYYEAGKWPTKAAACLDIAAKFSRAPKTVERWMSQWINDLDRDSAEHRP
jgi:hypothetical protein